MLTNKVSITVPYTFGTSGLVGEDYRAKILKAVKVSFANKFGGYTEYDAHGGYIAKDGTLVEENVTVVESLSNCDIAEIVEYTHKIAVCVQKLMKQETVLYTVNDIGFFS
jgi:hypothetical protein